MKIKDHMLHRTIPQSEYSPQVTYYSAKAVQGRTAKKVLENSRARALEFITDIPENSFGHRYGPTKWTVAQVLQHVIYYEEIMYEKCLIAIGEPPKRLKYEHYSQSGTAKDGIGKGKEQLLDELLNVRERMIAMLDRLSVAEQRQIGIMDGLRLSVRMFALCASGHQEHHFTVLRKKYLSNR